MVAWSYPVLAPLSRGYPKLEGRLPMYYSPVRRSTRPRRDFRARLACVRHAASVRSEPGSNSQNKPELLIFSELDVDLLFNYYFQRTTFNLEASIIILIFSGMSSDSLKLFLFYISREVTRGESADIITDSVP